MANYNSYLIEPDPFRHLESSYTQNEMGKKLASLVLQEKPKIVIEFGVLNGYSTLWLGKAVSVLNNRCHVYV